MTLAQYGLGGLALYLLSPALGGALLGGLRGYAGDINAVQALEAINREGNAVIVDIRSLVRARRPARAHPPAPASTQAHGVQLSARVTAAVDALAHAPADSSASCRPPTRSARRRRAACPTCPAATTS